MSLIATSNRTMISAKECDTPSFSSTATAVEGEGGLFYISERDIKITTSGSDTASGVKMNDMCTMSQEDFDEFLERNGLDVTELNDGNSRTTRDLLKEVVSGRCSLHQLHGQSGCQMQRRCKILVIELQAKVLGKQMFLAMYGDAETANCHQRITVTMHTEESPEEALGRCLSQYFGLREHMAYLDILSIAKHEELNESNAYWGLTTVYDIYEVFLSVRDSTAPVLSVIGLPSGNEFTTTAQVGVDRQIKGQWVDGFVVRAIRRNTAGSGKLSSRRPSQTVFDIPGRRLSTRRRSRLSFREESKKCWD